MASPFPGMDPYLESFWGDIHHALITYARDQLQGRLPGDLRARVEERVFVESSFDERRSIVPDVHVVERPRPRFLKSGARSSHLAAGAPLLIQLPHEPVSEGYIEIVDLGSGKKVVTVVEVLSLSNKMPGPGQKLYLKKQEELVQAGVNLVEIDLLRDGDRILSIPQYRIPTAYRTAYQVSVRRSAKPWFGEIYAVPLRECLPNINIPLRETDADAILDLQALIEQSYRNGGYDDDIDYQTEPEPPLNRSDTKWADALLRKQGRRRGHGRRNGRRPRNRE